jgi:dienelactone hydrolase
MPRTEPVEHTSNGETFAGHLALPDGAYGPRPGVLVIHDGFGWGQHAKDRCAMLTELGYVAYAPDMFGAGADRSVIGSLVADTAMFRARLAGALAVLSGRSEVDAARLGAIGFCFGGRSVLELARSGADLRCVVSFHGSLGTNAPAEAGAVQASVVVCTGADDPHCPTAERTAFEAEMTAAGADWTLVAYSQTVHGFANPALATSPMEGVLYSPRADARSWRAMVDAFAEAFV